MPDTPNSPKEWRELVKEELSLEQIRAELEKERNLHVRLHKCPTHYTNPYTVSYGSFMQYFTARRNDGDPPEVVWIKEIIDGKERVHKGRKRKSENYLHDTYNSFSLYSDESLSSTPWNRVQAMWELYCEEKFKPILAD